MEATVARQDRRRGYAINALLGTLAVVGIMSIAVVAPNLFSVLPKGNRAQRKQYIDRTLVRAVDKGYARFTKDRLSVEITEKGRLYFECARARSGIKWDGKWRIVMFDIPEKRRATREKVRAELERFGFKHLQDSVWAFPYPCESLVSLIKIELRVTKNLIYIVTDQMDNDGILRDEFNL